MDAKLIIERIEKHYNSVAKMYPNNTLDCFSKDDFRELIIMAKLGQELKEQIGSLPKGTHPDEYKPRGNGTWLSERECWKKEIQSLQADNLEKQKEISLIFYDLKQCREELRTAIIVFTADKNELFDKIQRLLKSREIERSNTQEYKKIAQENADKYFEEHDKAVRLQAENDRLREALERLAKLGNGDRYGNSDGNVIAQDALKGGS